MTEQERAAIVEVLSRKIQEEGFLKLNTLSRVFDAEGLDRTLYASSGPKRWIREQFPEFTVLGNNGRETLRLSRDPLAQIYRILEEILEQKGQVLIAQIPQDYLSPKGIDYKNYTMGKRLSEWLPEAFPEFAVSEDKRWLYRANGPAPKSTPGQAPAPAPAPVPAPAPLSPAALAEIQKMHGMAFMNWWNNNTRKLRSYNEALADENQVKAAVAHRMTAVFLGDTEGLVNGMGEEEARIAFNTGLQNRSGSPIFCVLIPNPRSGEGGKQDWLMLDFACPEEETPLGQWLRSHLVSSYRPTINFASLEEMVRQVDRQREALLARLRIYLDRLSRGQLPEAPAADAVAGFEEQAEQLRELFQNVWNQPYPPEATLQQVAEQVGGKTAALQRLQAAVEQFDTVAEQTRQMFVQDRLPVGEQATPQKDREAIHRQYDSPGEEVDFRLFEETLRPYRVLRRVMEAAELSDEIDRQIETVLLAHFPEISYRFAVRFLMGSEEGEWVYLRQLDSIEALLRDCQSLAVHKEPEAAKISVTAEELLSENLAQEGSGTAALGWAQAVFPDCVPERLLVLGELEAFRDYLERHPEEPLATPENRALAADPSLTRERTCRAAAERLLRAEGNQGRLAEKYYILGLASREKDCDTALLRLYREENNQAAFRKVWQLASGGRKGDLENQVYYLSVLCREDPEEARRYARENVYLLYRPESLSQLLCLPAGALGPEEARVLEERRRQLAEQASPNPMEQAIVEGKLPRIRELAAAPEDLAAMGYTAEEIQRLAQAAAAENASDCESREDYDTGLRLYRFQKNLHGLAERYMWSGIAGNPQIHGSQLMLVLAQEGRWQECRMLYEAYANRYAEDTRCRQLYLIARLRLDPAGTQEYIREHLQDCLWMLDTMPLVQAALQDMADSDEAKNREFYGQVLELGQLLKDPMIKSVVTLDRNLREYAAEAYSREQEVPEAYARRIGEVYRSDSYPRGMDQVSVARRAFQFFGAYRGAAEAFARFALPDEQAAELLWDLYRETGEEEQQFQLMQEYRALRERHRELYRAMLFRRGAYMEFLEKCPPAEDSWSQQLEAFIAELKLYPDTRTPLPLLPDLGEEEPLAWFREWGSLLTASLVEVGRRQDLETVLFAGFNGWLDAFPEETLRALVTGRDSAEPALLETVQEDALKQKKEELALYLYQCLHIGALSGLAEQFLEQALAQLEHAPAGEQLRGIRRLQCLGGGAPETPDNRIALLEIRLIRENPAFSLEEETAEIGRVLLRYPAEAQAVEQLLPLLEDGELLGQYPVYAGLAQLAERLEKPQPVLRFFQRIARLPEMEENSEYHGFLCRVFVRAFDRGLFPEDLLTGTEEWCAPYCRQHQTAEGLLCLYFTEKALGRDAFARYLLRVLTDQPADQVGEELGQVLSAQLQALWGANLPSYFELFKAYLMQASVEEVEQYIAFAHLASGEEEYIQGQRAEGDGEKRMLSESESNALVRRLYANPQDAGVWRQCTKLPLQDNPVGYAKLLFLACLQGAFSWLECAEYCEKYEQWELLLQVLLSWAESVPAEEVAACRMFLEERLAAHPDYFVRWGGQEELLRLSHVLCSRVKQTEVEYHATLRAVSLISVKTGFPEAVSYLMERFGKALLGKCCNLGVVMAVHLLLEERYAEAGNLLGMLKNVLGRMNYRELVDSLAGMGPEELAKWTEDAENTIMLNLILPDGNTPNLQQINAIVYEGIQKGQAGETAHVLCRVLGMFPDDYGIYNGLFDLCCTEFDGFLPILHRCLRGLVRLQPVRNSQSYYRRDQRQYARMLAALDALLLAGGGTGEIADYDFSRDTGEFYRRVGAASLPYSEPIAVSAVREHVASALRNRSPKELARLALGYRSCITGNWLELLRDAWAKKEDIQSALECRIEQVEDVGFGRSVLRLLLETEPDQRGTLVGWLRKELAFPERTRPQGERQQQLQFVEDFLNGGYFSQLESQIEFGSLETILNNPFEDYSLSPFLREKYVDAAIRKNSEQLYALAWLTGALICHNGYQTELDKLADRLFDQGDDSHACSLYLAMYRLHGTFGLAHIDFRTGKSAHSPRRIREEYEARYRVTALFSGKRGMMVKVGASHFHVWSCINLVLTLAYSPRADEVLRLATYLSKENSQLAQAVMRGLDPAVADAEKLEAVDTLYSDVAKAYYCYVVKYPYNPYSRNGAITACFGLSGDQAAEEMNRRYVSLAHTLLSQKDSAINSRMMPFHLLLLESRNANSKVSSQKDPLLWSVSEETVDSTEKELPEETPFFAEGLEPLYSAESPEELLAEHRQIQSLAGTVQTKAELSKKIYRRCLAGGTPEERWNALLLMGSDCYYAALSAGDTETANRTVLALAGLLKRRQTTGYGREEAVKAMPNALYGLLQSFRTLGELLACYGEHRSLFHYMRSLLDDALLMACVGQIYTVLDNLRNCYASAARENPENLREELSANYRQLENIESNRWMDLKNKVQKLINDEINELDQRPVLRFMVLSQGTQRPFGTLSGQVQNIGQAAARHVVIQASYSDNSHSRQYVLSRLEPGSQAVFELDYDCAANQETLGYLLNASFSHNGKQYASVVAKGELSLGAVELPAFPADLLCRDPNGIAFRVDPETGEVYSPDFVGRKEETAMLRSLVEGENFAAYRSALIYGIRRTGKSSLLNYLAAYLQSHCPQVLCVKTDCQNMRGYDHIQYVFVDRVLDEAETQLPELAADSRWIQLKAKWSAPAYCADQEPEKLSLFYRQLKPVLGGRGVYLIIDEIDRLFQRVEENRQGDGHRNLDGLFGALSEMLNQVECKAAVHFAICGSNWLIRYNLKGEKINQLFQRFGKQVMEVGKLPETDMQEVIRRPYKGFAELEVTPEAMQWIWNYTGGLVWHTKLLAQDAIERAKRDFRSRVFPADVQQSVPQVITDEWCKQFYEGCESGEEFRVIDAMQSLAANRNAYIHIDRIRELLGQELVEVQRTMKILQALNVVAQHPVNQQLYSFGQDIYRRYFRTQPSRYPRVPDEPDIFQAVQQAQEARADVPEEKKAPDKPDEEDYSGLF